MAEGRSGGGGAPIAKLSLRAKGILVVAVPVVALLVATILFFQSERRTRQAQFLVEHSHSVRSEVRRVLIRMVNAETGLRGYLLTERESYLEPYWTARREMSDPLQALRDLEIGDSASALRVAKVESLVARTLEWMEGLRREAAGGRSARAVARLDEGKALMDELRGELVWLEAREQRELDDSAATLAMAQKGLRLAMVTGGALGLIGGLAAILLFTAGISRRIQALEGVARRVAEGQRIEGPVTGQDEIARLERTLQETSRLLTENREELQAAHAEMERRVILRTAELQAANEALREANEMTHAVIQSSPLAIWAMDLDGNVTFWNPGAERMFGWTEGEVIGRPFPAVPPEDWEEFEKALERFRAGHAVVAEEQSGQKKDGSKLDVLVWTAPLRDASGQTRGTIGLLSDETQRKLLEEQFRQSQKLEAVGRLAGGVAHDFNNLLTVITGYNELMIDDLGNQPELLEYAAEIQQAADRAGALTAQLLAFSRRQISQPRVVDLNEVVLRSVKMLRRVIGEDIDLATHLDSNLARVKADPTQLDQIIMNLVVNARDAMEHGGRLTIETGAAFLEEDFSERHIGVEAGPYSMLAISDTGIGMDAETKARIFEPFFTTKQVGKGTGLGLSIVYGIVKQNGGEIIVYSEPGKGTSFKIYFPAVATGMEEASTGSRPAQLRGTETILLCEDEERIRRLVHTMLTRLGYRVIETAGPEEALRIVREDEPAIDLLFTDIVMPKMSGFELARQTRALLPAIKVLYMSGYTDNQLSGSWVLDPNMHFIQKPFTATALTDKVREALGRVE